MVTGAADAQSPSPNIETIVQDLVCRTGQECNKPSRSKKRSFRFEPHTEDERQELEKRANDGRLPSTNIEVYFDYNSAQIAQPTREALDALGRALTDARLANSSFALIGHTDAKGSASFNQVLSEQRANAVRQYLVQTFSIEPSRLHAFGRGKSAPKLITDPFAAANRRVQVVNSGVVSRRE